MLTKFFYHMEKDKANRIMKSMTEGITCGEEKEQVQDNTKQIVQAVGNPKETEKDIRRILNQEEAYIKKIYDAFVENRYRMIIKYTAVQLQQLGLKKQ